MNTADDFAGLTIKLLSLDLGVQPLASCGQPYEKFLFEINLYALLLLIVHGGDTIVEKTEKRGLQKNTRKQQMLSLGH